MGGTSYDRDVYPTSRSSSNFNSRGSGYSPSNDDDFLSIKTASPLTSPIGQILKSDALSNLVVITDVTGSNGKFSKIIYKKAPMLYGQVEQQGYMTPGFAISIIATGDAYTDRFPLQVSPFSIGKELDIWLERIFLEGGGGGQVKETYELAAYYLSQHLVIPNNGFSVCCIIGDEAPYPSIRPDIVKKHLGDNIQGSIATDQVFSDLLRLFNNNVFVLLNPYCGLRIPINLETEQEINQWKRQNPETEQVVNEWKRLFPRQEQIIEIKEEESIVDLILGVIALSSKKRDLSGYIQDMANRDQTLLRQQNVSQSLQNVSKALVSIADSQRLPTTTPTVKRTSGSKRF